ncbi:hypothetical protein [Acuticoccus sp. I52.16.1]|uniref:hypothetical protein n=1 Tax=Acuticoccus sp. I52.16.1 TaxID=2928472 RepID=UPI001FD2AC7E|nr:hypothetical protein [Acuticoccus sp. I52.16.1]UOM33783.1 hypothetical protein MRB58_18395 [Acuticoccus sp. I52.16.1]
MTLCAVASPAPPTDRTPATARIDDAAEAAARRLLRSRALTLPVLDAAGTLVGVAGLFLYFQITSRMQGLSPI